MNADLKTLITPSQSTEYKASNKITYKIAQQDPKETEDMYTTKIGGYTKIRMKETGELANMSPMTMHTAFEKAVQKFPKLTAFYYKYRQEDKFLTVSFAQYYQLSCMAAKSFIKLGLKRRNSVCISGYNSPHWLLSYMGAIFSAGISSGIYITTNDEMVEFILNDCSCQVAVVGSAILVERYIKISKNIPTLKAIVQYYGITENSLKSAQSIPVYDWVEFLKLGKDVSDENLVKRLNTLIPNECCSLIYTSGTTGNPKGVMMSHDNLLWTACNLKSLMNFRDGKEIIISFLPLSHVAAQMCDVILGIITNISVYFAQPDALKGTLGVTLKEVRPTYFIGVPRVFEKISEQMKEIGLTISPLKKKISAWAKDIGYRTSIAKMEKVPGPYGYFLANFLVFKNVKKALGFDRCKGIYSAAAPLSQETIKYFASLDIIIGEVYGMSECSGPQSIEFMDDFLFGSVGKFIPEFPGKIFQPDKDGEGEICISGRHVFMGYLKNEEKNKEIFDNDYWIHSGDVGKIDNNGFLHITGRIKDIIITAGGENIAPIPIEEKLKENLPLISNAMVVGDKKKFLIVLLTIKCIIDLDTQLPTDDLTPVAIRWCESINYSAKTVSEIVKKMDPKIVKAVNEAVELTNKSAVSNAARLQKWAFLPRDFTIGGGELGPTLKLKRNIAISLYQDIIDKQYE